VSGIEQLQLRGAINQNLDRDDGLMMTTAVDRAFESGVISE
jgi:hypothetical protein